MEDKYHILQTFADAKMSKIAKSLENAMAGELENLMMGGKSGANPFRSGESAITSMMKDFVASQEVERMGIPGVPTQAAKDGVNHRLSHPYRKANPRRPSFIDTGLMVSSYIAWIE
ncbi:hypothetical protein WM24_23825 [Burkholderia ubonensis]|nr:hypothetical protein WM24_23825 [Burkholderia ubonensis]